MAGLRRPVHRGLRTQNFGATKFELEPTGWFVERDAGGQLRAFRGHFPGGKARPHVHPAIDIAVPRGTHVLAVEAGRIKARGIVPSTQEKYLILRIRKGVFAFYTHLRDWQSEEGEKVKRGQVIALSGNTGLSTGPHLHFELRIKEDHRLMRYNPDRFFKGGDLADDPRIRPIGVVTPQRISQPTTTPAVPPEDDMPPLLDYRPGDVAIVRPGAEIRSRPAIAPDSIVRTLVESESPIVIGFVAGESVAGNDRWLMWGAPDAYEFAHDSQVESVEEPVVDCAAAVQAALAGDLGEDLGDVEDLIDCAAAVQAALAGDLGEDLGDVEDLIDPDDADEDEGDDEGDHPPGAPIRHN